jgi:hypothetical protein
MITYAYWTLAIALTIGVLLLVGMKFKKWTAAIILGVLIMIAAWSAYNFHYEQLFVKNWGGVMSLSVPEGQHHVTATWKDANLWIENYDPETNTCIFTEYSKGNMLQGKVTIKRCNPIALGE